MPDIPVEQLELSEAELRARDIIDRAMALRAYLDVAVAPDISDADAADGVVPALVFPIWNAGEDYKIGDRVRYDESLYRVIQAHQSQIDWTPDRVPALYAKLRSSQDDDPTIEDWTQPTAENPYQRGEKCRHAGSIWESLVDGNVWEPSAQTAALSIWKKLD